MKECWSRMSLQEIGFLFQMGKCSQLLEEEEESSSFHGAFEQWKKHVVIEGSDIPNGTLSSSKSKFDDKIEASSAKMYFHYYKQLLHQQNMLQDYVRTGSYYAAVIENQADFAGRVVVDVGAGSGILSLFAAQAGAKHVYAVEASEMANYAQKLIAGNPILAQRITVIKGKVEDVELPEKDDILISEPMGTLLINERMLESYVIARDRFLVPNGKMFPTVGRIHMAPFNDEYWYIEIANKVWNACKPNNDDPKQPNHEMDILAGHENDVNYVQFSGCLISRKKKIFPSLKIHGLPMTSL